MTVQLFFAGEDIQLEFHAIGFLMVFVEQMRDIVLLSGSVVPRVENGFSQLNKNGYHFLIDFLTIWFNLFFAFSS